MIEFWEDDLAYEATAREGAAAMLRARVKGTDPLVATATSAWTSKARENAATKGIALPDGSFPIKDKDDWFKARTALGRASKDKRSKVIKHLIKRARVLGIPRFQYRKLAKQAS